MARNRDTSMKSKIITLSTSLVLSCLSSQVFAAGFAIQEQNVTNLGLAYSGTGALAEDASTTFYNPAGLTRLNESEIVLSGIIIQGDFDFTASSATTSLPAVAGTTTAAVPGGNTDDPGTVAFVPATYISKRIDERWVFGFSINTPFGLDTEYQEDGIARYLATNSSIKTLNFSPNIAYEWFPCLSFGIGPDALWGKADLEARIGNGNASTDGFQKNHAQGWGYGWHAGVLWAPRTTTRLGLSYRSHVNFHAEGNSENLVPYSAVNAGLPVLLPIFPTQAGIYHIQRVRADITLPETWTLSLYHAFNECFALTADAAWTNWSRFHTLRLRFDPGASFTTLTGTTAGLDSDTWEHFKDARRAALGLIYTYNPNWQFKGGVQYDQSPIRGDFRTARLPDNDRYWLALGAGYTVNESVKIDVAYAHIFFKDSDINEHAPFSANTVTPLTAATLSGSYEGNANIFGVQIRYDFV
mgnify:CR=1 FL=1